MATKNPGKDKGDKPGPDTVAGLRGRCTVRVDATRAQLGGIAASLLDGLSDGAGNYAVDFLLTPDRQRVTYGTAGKSIVVVHHRRGNLVVWDDSSRMVATIPADGMPRTRIAPARTLETSVREHGEETTFTVTLDDTAIGPARHELTVSRRQDLMPFGPALLRVLHCGPGCHAETGLPWDQIAKAGLIVRERTFSGAGHDLISDLDVDSLQIVKVTESDFQPPDGYQPLEEMVKKTGEPPAPPPPAKGEPTPHEAQQAVIKQALEDSSGGTRRSRRIIEKLTPDCMGSTRLGSMTASLHQDALTLAANAINTAAPLLGSTTIAAGTWTVPWLSNLAAVNAASATAPGSGMFCFLRVPRVSALPPGTAGGGIGLLDRLAFRSLYEVDGSGMTRTQRESAAGTLAATLSSWMVPPAADAALQAAGGDMTMISPSDQRDITDAYEVSELGTFRITGLPGTPPAPGMAPFGSFSFGSMTIAGITTPPLFTIGVTGLGGTVNFGSLGGGPLVTAATIGGSGNFVLGLSLPTITVMGTVTRTITFLGRAVLTLGTIGFCFAFPFLCPWVVTLVVLASFILNNVTTVTATATGVTWTLDVTFDFDPTTERVEPFVSLIGRTGTVTIGTFGPTPNVIGNFMVALVAAFGNLFDVWHALLAALAVPAIQTALRNGGLQLPVANRQNELRALDGNAVSSAGALLQLSADVRPIDDVASQPYTTQVVTRDSMRQQLLVAHLNIRRDLNPQPAVPPPGPGPAIAVGTLAGLGLSQNALNYYIFQQWLQHRFEATITDPILISKVVGPFVPAVFVRFPTRIHIWPASAPRIEIAPSEIALGTRPLVVFFDDVRACFELPNPVGTDGMTPFVGAWELSCNFKTTATVELEWPWVFRLRIDPVRPPMGQDEPRTWEFIDPNVPGIMGTVTPQNLAGLVDFIADVMIAPLSTAGVQAATGVRPWTRPLPAMQQQVFPSVSAPPLVPQQVYLEMMARRKGLYILPAIDTTLLELFDGSGAPTLNTIVLPLAGAPGPLPVTLRTMRCAQGAALRDFLLPLIGLPAGP